jgi:hypothetical protein
MTLHIAITRRNCYYTIRASVYISKSQVFQYAGISCKEQNFSMPAYVIFCIVASIFYILASMFYNPASIFYVPASISYVLASISYISGLRYFSLLAHQVIKWYLESQACQYANISWHEQSFSMPTYHGMSKVSVCQHIRAWAKFQYASISWHQPKSPNHHLFRFASISRHLSITHIVVYFGMPAYHGIL